MARDELSYVEAMHLVDRARTIPPAIHLRVDIEMGSELPTTPQYVPLENAHEKATVDLGGLHATVETHAVPGATTPTSYVSSLEFTYPQRRYVFQLDRRTFNPYLRRNINRPTWVRFYEERVKRHGREHFRRYRRVLADLRVRMLADLERSLPSRNNPATISQSQLDEWLNRLMEYWHNRIAFELKRDSCNWERQDYPRIIAEVRRHGGPRLHTSIPDGCRRLSGPVYPGFPQNVRGQRP